MSRVFVAMEHALNRTVVVKVLRQELAADVNRERFRREIMLAAQLQHPLIVPVLSAGEHRELLWYTMPFVEGESLREEIRRTQPVPARNAIRVLHDVLDALAYAHARGVVHRDIKPGNILRHGNHSLVTDFGVAKALSASLPSSGTTSAGMAIGTPAYMAPEQLAADPNANHRMDIYAVGLLVYELLTGSQAFAESSPQATMAAQLTRMPRHLSEVRPDLPAPLSALVMKMLAKSPDDRPQSATEALNELDAIVTPTGVIAPQSIGSSAKPWIYAAAALAVAAISFAVYHNSQKEHPTTTAAATQDSLTTPVVVPPPVPAPSPVATKADSVKARLSGVRGGSLKTTAAPAPTSTAAKVAPAAKTASAAAKTTSVKTTPLATRPRVPLLNRRVAVMPFRLSTNRENIAAASQALYDSLRASLAGVGYTLATDSELLRLVTQQNMVGGGLRRAASDAGLGAVVIVDLVARADEVNAITQVLDVWRAQTSSGREAADLDKPMELLTMVRTISRSLDRVAWRSRDDPRRVMIFEVDNLSSIDSLSPLARQLHDSLRAAVSRAGAIALPLDSTIRDTKDVTERRTLAIRRGVGAIVAASILRVRVDSVMIRLSVRDMSEERTFPNVENRVAVANIRSSFTAVAARLVEMLNQVNWGPKVVQSP
jgi:serine/threonine protein kinase